MFDDMSSIVEDPVEELDAVVAQPMESMKTEPIVRILPSGIPTKQPSLAEQAVACTRQTLQLIFEGT
jgi:hypothetical protein